MSQTRKTDQSVQRETAVIRTSQGPGPPSVPVAPSLHPSSTFRRLASEQGDLAPYARDGNPTYFEVETLLATLEGGAAAMVFASGMAAAAAVFDALPPGSHVVAQRQMYWALRAWLQDLDRAGRLHLDLVPAADPESLRRSVRPGETRMVWLESPANPTTEVTDLSEAASIVHDAGADLAVDSTLATPVLTRPLAYGVDIVMHSATKALNGHSDILAGALVTARDDALWRAIRRQRQQRGAVLGSFEAWLLLRGLRTLVLRVERSCANALAIANYLDQHPSVVEVSYPGLPQHPQHRTATLQMPGGFGYVLSFRPRGGMRAARQVARSLRIFTEATSLGGVESLVEHRASVEGSTSELPDDLLRLSIGIEHVDDLVGDLAAALASECAG
jgi:cystathionine gamma-synthase